MGKAFSDMGGLAKPARLLLLDIVISQGAKGAVDIERADAAALAALDQRGYVEAFLPDPRASWGGGRFGRRAARVTQRGRGWIQGVLESGRWRLTEADERGRWDATLGALRSAGEVWTAPVAEVLERGAEWGQAALGDDDADAEVVTRVATLFAQAPRRSAALDRLIADAPVAGEARRRWLARADEVAQAWGRPLFGPGGWLPGYSAQACPVVSRQRATWEPTRMPHESRRATVEAR